MAVGSGVNADASRTQPAPGISAPIAAAVNAPVIAEPRVLTPAKLVDDGSFVIGRAADGLFYVNVTIEGSAVKFLVDTGANVTVLTRKDAERLGLTGNDAAARKATMQTAGGPTAMQWTKIPKMSIANKPVTDVDAAIIEQGIQVSLLGQNVLSRLDGMTFSGDQLKFH